MAAREGDEGLVRGVVPVDGRLDLSPEISAGEKGVEDPHAVKVEPVGVRAEMLEEVRQGFGGGDAPEMFFPKGDQSADFFISLEGVLEAGADVATVNTGNPGDVGVVAAGELGECFGENSRGFRTAGGNALLNKLLQAAAENREDGEGALGEEKVAQNLKPDDHKLDGVFALKGFRIPD